MKFRIPTFLLLLCFISTLSVAQNKTTEKKLQGFDQFVERVMKDWKVQGLSLAIVQKGKVVYTKGYGYRDVQNKLPVTSETLFAIGSCTKAFTAADVCLLQNDGKLDLDEPVRTYMPDFKLFDAYASENMTARDLLSHRSGLPRHDMVWYGSSFTRKELYERLRFLEPNKPFRTTYQYQNLMFMTAGHLVETVSGKSWEAFTKEKILGPLEMNATNFSIVDLQKAKDFSIGYVETKDKVNVIPYMNIDAMGPAGSINSNANDMSKWLITLINGGKFKGKQILSSNTIREIQTPTMVTPAQIPVQYDESFYNTYGLAWMISAYRGHVRLEHGGNIDGFSASTCFMPRDSIGVVVLTNMNGTALPSVIRNNVLDRMLGLPEVDWNKRILSDVNKAKAAQAKTKKEEDANQVKNTMPSHPLADYTGTYEHPGYGTIEITLAENMLSANVHGLKTKLAHYHYDVFVATDSLYFEGDKISFLLNLKGEVDELHMKLEPAVKDVVFKRKVVGKSVDASTLSGYVGEYDFGGALAKVYIKQDSILFLVVPGQPEYELVNLKPNEFKIKTLEGFNVRFEMDSNGKVTELLSIQPNGTFRAKRK